MATLKRKTQPKVKVAPLFVFFYCTKNVTQHSLFEGQPDDIVSISVGDGHVMYRGRLMCNESMEKLKNATKADGSVTSPRLPSGVPMCAICDEKYKAEPESPWYKFVHGIAKT